MIENSTCFAHVQRDPTTGRLIDAPPVYLSTGIFIHHQDLLDSFQVNVHDSVDRSTLSSVEYTLLRLYEVGLDTIYTKEIMMKLMKANMTAEEQSKVDFAMYESLFPEQLAFVDLQIARHSHCFCPANVQTSFSYFALRLRAWDRHEDLHMALVTKEKYHKNAVFANWGM